MKRMTFATATAVVALAAAGVATGVQAADLIVDEPAPAYTAPAVGGLYIQGYLGAALGGTLTWDDGTEYDLDLGWALGGAIGFETGIEGLSVEADVLHTRRISEGDADYVASTTSLMVDAKYTFHLGDTFDVYAGAGLGGVYLNYDSAGTIYDGWGFGYQVMIGASVNVADNISIFGEFRHQDTFSDVDVDNGYTLRTPVNAVLVGLKLEF